MKNNSLVVYFKLSNINDTQMFWQVATESQC